MTKGAVTGMEEVDGMTPARAFRAGLDVAKAENERLRKAMTDAIYEIEEGRDGGAHLILKTALGAA